MLLSQRLQRQDGGQKETSEEDGPNGACHLHEAYLTVTAFVCKEFEPTQGSNLECGDLSPLLVTCCCIGAERPSSMDSAIDN